MIHSLKNINIKKKKTELSYTMLNDGIKIIVTL